MSYSRDNGLDRARQRRRRRATAIAALVAIVVFAGFAYAVSYFAGWVPGSRPPAPPASCTVTPPPPPQAAVVLNVYNASGDTGQATDVANAMTSRNFNVGVVSNDPYQESLDGVGQIRFGPAGKAFAEKYVKPLVPGATMVEDGRTDSSVDLALGKAFPHLATAKPTPTPTIPGC
ncbi:LytR C-terminal domain-containing protein [Leekyejoonella antrihumi]|uniref:LytR family transcriptional regulator n=1 Tax=Leekyejoonella antrihumi TaxID=1660198 RepID=A0A563DUN1_9MICO|nr:LytR C-terminal domain-containing protein [Leekyejoonella antrihumi]TWP33970.1 LytR family transcriptional regulator [Leekyejoonella antrihumi]